MESFLNEINGIHADIVEAEQNADKLIVGFEIKFQQLLQKYAPVKVSDTPIKPSKKKLKNRIERTASQDVDETINSVSSATSSSAITIATGINETDVRADETQQYMRPVRTARKQITSMKEPTLNRKMRREAESTTTVKIERVSNGTTNDSGSTVAKNAAEIQSPIEITDGISKEPMPPPPPSKKVPTVKVKQEKLSIMTKNSDTSSSSDATASSNANEKTVITSAPTAKRKSSDEGIASIGEREEDASTSKKSNDSVEIIPTETRVIDVSDDEQGSDDEQRMPPPAIVPPAVKPKERKPTSSKSSKSSSVSDSGSEMPTKRSTRSKQPRPRIIKQEPVDETSDTASSSLSSSNKTRSEQGNETNGSSVASTIKPAKENKNASKEKQVRPLNTTGESLYEDAISDQPNRMFNSYVRIEKVPLSELPSSQSSDATFVSTSEEPESRPLSPRATYVIPKNAKAAETNPNATFQVNDEAAKVQPINDQTVDIPTKSNGGAIRKKKLSAASIMTEDDSDSGGSTVDVPYNNAGRTAATSTKIASKKNTKELFNPCVQKTTVKQKAEAFEKLASPVAVQRETRTRTRQLTATDTDKFVKPQNPVKTASTTHMRTNSATRLAQSSSKYPSASSLQKAQSVEEIRKKHQAALTEKKTKNKIDEKLKQAQLHREAQEQGKAEKLRKIFLEKEQRIKENQQKKQLEELRKQQEQKRREAEREQSRKEFKAAADRKERENLKILAEQKALQEKLKANKRLAESEAAQHYNPYNFDMIESGDSTDDEGKDSRKRPAPPSWSLSHNRMPYIVAQSNIDSKVIDTFFSVAPRQVDLRAIFPTIEDKHLRRNSSAVWNTPPRYSLMPKY